MILLSLCLFFGIVLYFVCVLAAYQLPFGVSLLI